MRSHPTGLAWLLGLLVSPVLLVIVFVGPSVWNSDVLIDAASFRNGAQFVGTPNLYNPDAYSAAQRQELAADEAFRTYLRPPWYAAASAWLADMPYRAAMNAWRVLMAGFALLFVLTWRERREAGLAIFWSIPLLSSLLQGQDDTLMLAALGACLLLLRSQRDVAAGVVLAFCVIKPHFFLFIPIAVIAARRTRLGIGLAVGLALQAAASFAVQGPEWPSAYLSAIMPGESPDVVTNGVSFVYLFKTLGPAVELGAAIVFAAAAAYCVYGIARSAPLALGLCAAVAAAVITSPHAFLQDMLLVVPLALLSLESAQLAERRLAMLFLSSAWAVVYLVVASQGPSISAVATLTAVLPTAGLLIMATRTTPDAN